MLRSVRYLGLLAMLAACAGGDVSPPTTPPQISDTCNAAQYASLMGQDATALERVLIMGMVRVIRPGDMVTQDFRPERINFGISSDNRIIDISCG